MHALTTPDTMFTGLVEDIGTLRSRQRHGDEERLEIATTMPTDDFVLGESIAVNGCCLTVTSITEDSFTADASSETMRVTSLGQVQVGGGVHLERAMPANGRLGGHIVQGHVDGVGTIDRIVKDGKSWQIYVNIPAELRPEVVAKGSIALDGVSLTVNEITPTGCRVTIIPFTSDETLLTALRAGSRVNIETDIIGKYVRHLMNFSGSSQPSGMRAVLKRAGYLSEEEP